MSTAGISGEPAIALSAADRLRVASFEDQAHRGADGLAALLDGLADGNWVVRRAVAGMLARQGDAALAALENALVERRSDEAQVAALVDALAASDGQEVTPRMLALTEHPNAAVVCDALQVLGRRRAIEAVGRLAELSASEDDNVAVAAIEALGRTGGDATIAPLLRAVESRVFFRTFPAIDALGRSGDPRAVPPLASLVTDGLYGLEAIRALGHTAHVAAVAPLAALLTRPVVAVVRTAAAALVELRDRYQSRQGEVEALEVALAEAVPASLASFRLAGCVDGAGSGELVAIARLLAWLGDDAAVATLLELTDHEAPAGDAALQALRSAGPRVAPHAVALLPSANSRRRARLLPLIGSVGGNLQPVLDCLDDADPGVRVLACDALARFGDTGAVTSLFRLIGDPDARVAQASAAAIQSLGSRETRALALKQARAEDPGTRRAALRILSYFGYPEALDILLEAAEDDDAKIREPAAQGLALLDDPRAQEGLVRIASHAQANTRAAAMRALGQTTSTPTVVATLSRGLTDADAWVRYYATQGLGRLRAVVAASALVERLDDEAGQVRVAAIESLSLLGTDEAQCALERAAVSADEDIARAALVGMGLGKRPGSVVHLLEATTAAAAATRLVAIASLAEFPGPEVAPALARALLDEDDAVRSAAIGYLGTRAGVEASTALIERLADPALHERLIAALAVPVEQRVETIVEALATADDERAAALVSALVRMRQPAAEEALATALQMENAAARRASALVLASRRRPADGALPAPTARR
jgi:HEAT repeat protein